MDDMNTILTKTAEAWAGGTVALAQIFEISHSAVSQWGDTIPKARTFELRTKRPEWFFKNGNIKPAPKVTS